MCIVTASSENEHQLGFRCACNIGWMLASDLRNCYCKYLLLCTMCSLSHKHTSNFLPVSFLSGSGVLDVIPAEVHQGTYFRSCN